MADPTSKPDLQLPEVITITGQRPGFGDGMTLFERNGGIWAPWSPGSTMGGWVGPPGVSLRDEAELSRLLEDWHRKHGGTAGQWKGGSESRSDHRLYDRLIEMSQADVLRYSFEQQSLQLMNALLGIQAIERELNIERLIDYQNLGNKPPPGTEWEYPVFHTWEGGDFGATKDEVDDAALDLIPVIGFLMSESLDAPLEVRHDALVRIGRIFELTGESVWAALVMEFAHQMIAAVGALRIGKTMPFDEGVEMPLTVVEPVWMPEVLKVKVDLKSGAEVQLDFRDGALHLVVSPKPSRLVEVFPALRPPVEAPLVDFPEMDFRGYKVGSVLLQGMQTMQELLNALSGDALQRWFEENPAMNQWEHQVEFRLGFTEGAQPKVDVQIDVKFEPGYRTRAESTLGPDAKFTHQTKYMAVMAFVTRHWGTISEVGDAMGDLLKNLSVNGVQYRRWDRLIEAVRDKGVQSLEFDGYGFMGDLLLDNLEDMLWGHLSTWERDLLKSRFGPGDAIMNLMGLPTTWFSRFARHSQRKGSGPR